MTDSSGVLQDWRVVLSGCVAVLTASVVALVVRTGDPATADSFLEQVRAAAVQLPGGSLVSAQDGMRVPAGAVVRTGAGGSATITTAGRAVYLGSVTTVQVTDGVRQSLQRGQVMVDSRNGPHLDLMTRAGLAAIADETLVRVETGPVLRLAVFDGGATLAIAGRQATRTVHELYQLQAPYTGLPGAATALTLADDLWEQRLAPDLVNADRDLNALAAGLTGADGVSVLQAAPVALRRVVDVQALSREQVSTDRGEQALSVAIAQTSTHSDLLQSTLAFVQRAREQGGSWGVVAALVDARVSAVSALLDTVLTPPGQTPPPVVAVGSERPIIPGLTQSPSPRASEPSSGPTQGPTQSPRPHHTSRPSHSASPSATQPADDLITTLSKLLSPSPSAKGVLGGLGH